MSNHRHSAYHDKARQMVRDLMTRYAKPSVESDPVYFVHRYSDPRDQEIVAFISALLAFGNVKSIHASLERILKILGDRPAQRIAVLDEKKEGCLFMDLPGHRWVRGADLWLLVRLLQVLVVKEKGVKEFFLKGHAESQEDVGSLIERASSECLTIAASLNGKPLSRGFKYFFPVPSKGSPCKRLNMFLRWVVRPADGVDLGLWPEISPSQLIVPLDTHLFRFAKRYRLSRFQTAQWRVAKDVTNFLKTIDPADPVRHDFAICHYGMEEGW